MFVPNKNYYYNENNLDPDKTHFRNEYFTAADSINSEFPVKLKNTQMIYRKMSSNVFVILVKTGFTNISCDYTVK